MTSEQRNLLQTWLPVIVLVGFAFILSTLFRTARDAGTKVPAAT